MYNENVSTYRYRGGKLRRWNKLSKDQRISLLMDFINAFTLIKDRRDIALFVTDLLTADEVKIISKRLRIAKLLLSEWSYEDIDRYLKASPNTIAKVASWLKEKGEGLRKVINKLPEPKPIKNKSDFPREMWAFRMLESFDREAAKATNDELVNFLNRLDQKEIFRNKLKEDYQDELRQRK